MQNQDEYALIQQAQAGDEKAMTAIVLKYSVYLLSLFLRQVRTNVWDVAAVLKRVFVFACIRKMTLYLAQNLQTQKYCALI